MPFTFMTRALAGLAIALSLASADAAVSIRTIQSSGNARLNSMPMASGGGVQSPELSPAFSGVAPDEGVAANGGKSDEARDRKALRAASKRVVLSSIHARRRSYLRVTVVSVLI